MYNTYTISKRLYMLLNRVVSLFDGVSGGALALDRLGIGVTEFISSEVDKHALIISERHYPNHIRLGDVTKINFKNIKNVDLLIGGSPCQNLSFGGNMKGLSTQCNIPITSLEQYTQLKDEGFVFTGQSYLFWEYVRALKELKPLHFLLENVNMAKKWQNIFSSILGVEPIRLNSSLVSGQHRDRLYWTNIPFTPPTDKHIMFYDILEDLPFREFRAFMNRRYRGSLQWEYNKTSKCAKSHPVTTKNTHAIQYLLNPERNKMRTLSPTEYEILQTYPKDYTKGVANTHRYKCIGNSFTVDAIVELLKGVRDWYEFDKLLKFAI